MLKVLLACALCLVTVGCAAESGDGTEPVEGTDPPSTEPAVDPSNTPNTPAVAPNTDQVKPKFGSASGTGTVVVIGSQDVGI